MEPLYNYTKHSGKYESFFQTLWKCTWCQIVFKIYSYCDLLSDGNMTSLLICFCLQKQYLYIGYVDVPRYFNSKHQSTNWLKSVWRVNICMHVWSIQPTLHNVWCSKVLSEADIFLLENSKCKNMLCLLICICKYICDYFTIYLTQWCYFYTST